MVLNHCRIYNMLVIDILMVKIEAYRYAYVRIFTDKSPFSGGYCNDPPGHFHDFAFIMLT